MSKSTLVFYALCIVLGIWFVSVLFIPPLSVDDIYTQPSLTPTINFYKEDIFDQCRGLESLETLKEEYPSLEINGNYHNDRQRILANIERDKNILGYEGFVCP
jgi:hypothetical protein